MKILFHLSLLFFFTQINVKLYVNTPIYLLLLYIFSILLITNNIVYSVQVRSFLLSLRYWLKKNIYGMYNIVCIGVCWNKTITVMRWVLVCPVCVCVLIRAFKGPIRGQKFLSKMTGIRFPKMTIEYNMIIWFG